MDGHTFEAGSCLFKNSIARLAKHGTYIIEDVDPYELVMVEEFFRGQDYSVTYFNLFWTGMERSDSSLILIRKP